MLNWLRLMRSTVRLWLMVSVGKSLWVCSGMTASCVSAGIYAMMFPAVMYALWGTSRQAGVGPQSIPALLIGSAVTGESSCFTVLRFDRGNG